MTEQETRDLFRKRVIELNHPECETYEEAIWLELQRGSLVLNEFSIVEEVLEVDWNEWKGRGFLVTSHTANTYKWPYSKYNYGELTPIGFPITLARVLQALDAVSGGRNKYLITTKGRLARVNRESLEINYAKDAKWKLTEDGKECDADQQDIEVIEKLLTLL